MKITTIRLLLAGLIIGLIGAFLKIIKIEYANYILLLGVGFEIASLIFYISNRKKALP